MQLHPFEETKWKLTHVNVVDDLWFPTSPRLHEYILWFWTTNYTQYYWESLCVAVNLCSGNENWEWKLIYQGIDCACGIKAQIGIALWLALKSYATGIWKGTSIYEWFEKLYVITLEMKGFKWNPKSQRSSLLYLSARNLTWHKVSFACAI